MTLRIQKLPLEVYVSFSLANFLQKFDGFTGVLHSKTELLPEVQFSLDFFVKNRIKPLALSRDFSAPEF